MGISTQSLPLVRKTATINSSGAWPLPDGLVGAIKVIARPGAGSGASGNNSLSVGKGGNAGELIERLLDPADDLTITIGSGGSGSSIGAGNDGGDTVVTDGTTTITASGGKKGVLISDYSGYCGGNGFLSNGSAYNANDVESGDGGRGKDGKGGGGGSAASSSSQAGRGFDGGTDGEGGGANSASAAANSSGASGGVDDGTSGDGGSGSVELEYYVQEAA